MQETVRSATGEHELVVPSAAVEIAPLRHRVAELAREDGVDATIVDDLELVVSELATNVLLHSDAETISVIVRREPGRWVLDVADADGLENTGPDTLPDPDALTGRGLFIVKAMMDEVELIDDGNRRRLRCTKRVS